jgi:5-hydroxyisourate hydrolase-like protein (transthyretin family)
VPPGTASVSGTIGVVGTGQPARRARVTLSSAEGGGARTTTTDEHGRYVFGGLVAGRYNLSASKAGHVGTAYGAARPGRPGTPIQLAEGQAFAANLLLPRGSVITGTVVDEFGEPAPGTPVRAMRYVLQGGRRRLQQSGTGTTDDRGIYRIFGLQPGEYIVSAMPRNTGPSADVARLEAQLEAVRERMRAVAGEDRVAARELALRASMLQADIPAQGPDEQPTGYAPVYYPGTVAVAQSAPLAVGVGEERASVDFQLMRVPMARIEGHVINSTGQPAENVQLTLTDTQATPGVGTISTRADGEGRFRMANVAPGNYRLIARATARPTGRSIEFSANGRAGRGRGAPSAAQPVRLWGVIDVPVDGRDAANVVISLQHGLTVSGRVAFNGGTPPADLTRLRVNLVPGDPTAPDILQAANGRVDASGTFTIPSVVPGAYRLMAGGAGSGWTVESSVIDGQDSLDFPVEIKPGGANSGALVTFTDRQTELTGTITNRRGQPAAEQTLILYPAEERFWIPQSRRIRSTRPGTDGRFTFASLPPGDYRLVAIVDVEPGAWFDPGFLQQVDAAATQVTIADGEKKVIAISAH